MTPQSGNWVSTSLGNSGLCWTIFARNRDTAVPAEGNGDLQTLICVLVVRTRQCPTLSNPVPWQNWMAAYLGCTLRMKMLFRGWPVMVHDTHTRRRRRSAKTLSRQVIHALQILSASADSLTVYWVHNMFTQSWRLVINCVSKMCLTFSLKVGHNIYSVKFGENWPLESWLNMLWYCWDCTGLVGVHHFTPLVSLLFSSMRGRQQLSCPVLRPLPTGLIALKISWTLSSIDLCMCYCPVCVSGWCARRWIQLSRHLLRDCVLSSRTALLSCHEAARLSQLWCRLRLNLHDLLTPAQFARHLRVQHTYQTSGISQLYSPTKWQNISLLMPTYRVKKLVFGKYLLVHCDWVRVVLALRHIFTYFLDSMW